MSNFTIVGLAISETLDRNSTKRFYKLNFLCRFLEIIFNEHRLTQKKDL